MPQNGRSHEGIGQGPGSALLNGAGPHCGLPAAACTTRGRPAAGTLDAAGPPCVASAGLGLWYEAAKAAPPRTFGKRASPASSAAEAGGLRHAHTPGGVLVNGAASPDCVPVPCYSERMPAENQRRRRRRRARRRKFRHSESYAEVVSLEDPLMPPHVEEDWENEIQEISLTDFSDWEKRRFGFYGPDDVLRSALRDQTLTASYSPAVHHAHPVQWSCCSLPTEPDQFADADE